MSDVSNANKAQEGSSSFPYTCENNIDQIAMSKNVHWQISSLVQEAYNVQNDNVDNHNKYNTPSKHYVSDQTLGWWNWRLLYHNFKW